MKRTVDWPTGPLIANWRPCTLRGSVCWETPFVEHADNHVPSVIKERAETVAPYCDDNLRVSGFREAGWGANLL